MRIEPGTRALVTGPSRGIGRALAVALAGRGAVLGLASRSGDELVALAAELPGDHQVLPCDVGERVQVAAAVETFARAGGLDLVVANAGVAHYGPFHGMPVAKVEQMTRVNWLGTVHLVEAALPHMLARGSGHLVVVSSGSAWRGFPSAAAYGATKAAQRAFAEGLRHELTGTGVSLTTVFPGEIASSLHDHDAPIMPAWYRGGPDAAPAADLAAAIVRGIERDRAAVYFPRSVRLLAAVHGVSPRAADALLRRLRGPTAAPRRP